MFKPSEYSFERVCLAESFGHLMRVVCHRVLFSAVLKSLQIFLERAWNDGIDTLTIRLFPVDLDSLLLSLTVITLTVCKALSRKSKQETRGKREAAAVRVWSDHLCVTVDS